MGSKENELKVLQRREDAGIRKNYVIVQEAVHLGKKQPEDLMKIP